jgi:hypothetical protein
MVLTLSPGCFRMWFVECDPEFSAIYTILLSHFFDLDLNTTLYSFLIIKLLMQTAIYEKPEPLDD